MLTRQQRNADSWVEGKFEEFDEFEGTVSGRFPYAPTNQVYSTDLSLIRDVIRTRGASEHPEIADMDDDQLEDFLRKNPECFCLPYSDHFYLIVDEIRTEIIKQVGLVRPSKYPVEISIEVVHPSETDCETWGSAGSAYPPYRLEHCLMMFSEALDFHARTEDGGRLGIATASSPIKMGGIIRERNPIEPHGIYWTVSTLSEKKAEKFLVAIPGDDLSDEVRKQHEEAMRRAYRVLVLDMRKFLKSAANSNGKEVQA